MLNILDIVVNRPYSNIDFLVADDVTITNRGYGSSVEGYLALGDVDVRPFADRTWVDIDTTWGDVTFDNAWSSGGTFDYIGGSFRMVDSKYGNAFIGSVGHVEIDNSDEYDFTVGYSERGIVVVESDEGNLETGNNDDSVLHLDSFDFTTQTNGGRDNVTTINSGGVILTGDGDDFLYEFDSEVAYNLGAGRDHAVLMGGRTLGNTADGEIDTVNFSLEYGGTHTVVADRDDVFQVGDYNGMWDANVVDAIDNGGANGIIDLGNLFVEIIYVDDVSLDGKG